MESDLRGIGAVARQSGLSVSALRYYDGAGVLVPTWVDPATGYRWYTAVQVRDARLVAAVRRVGMPLEEIRRLLALRDRPAEARTVLAGHLDRLEDGLTAARRELSRAQQLIDSPDLESDMTFEHTPASASPPGSRISCEVQAADLATALQAVRFAVAEDPELPVLGTVLLEVGAGAVTAVATDRYRLAVADVPVLRASGVPVAVPVPARLVDDLLAAARTTTGTVTLTAEPGRISVRTESDEISGETADLDFPDHRALVRPSGSVRTATITADELRATVRVAPVITLQRETDGVSYPVTMLRLDADRGLSVERPDPAGPGDEPGALLVGVNQEFLLQAIDAAAGDQLTLDLGGPVAPLAVRSDSRPGTFSVLMPVRLP